MSARKLRFCSTTLPVVTVLLASFQLASAREARLDFAARVAAAEALARLQYAHQTAATTPFEEALPRERIEAGVERYLAQSSALERFWHTPVTAEALRAEMERQASQTRMPERLREMYRVLHDDPLLVQECLARPALVDRLVRSFYSRDPRFHAKARAEAERLRDDLVRQGLAAFAGDPRRVELRVAKRAVGLASGSEEGTIALAGAEIERWRAELPAAIGEIGAVREDESAFVIPVVVEDDEASARVVSFAVPKRPFEEWWRENAAGMEAAARSLEPVAAPVELPTLSSVATTCLPDDTWANMRDAGPIPRQNHAAVWTGSVMVVIGGVYPGGRDTPTVLHRYDPATDTWSPSASAPQLYVQSLKAVWTGSQALYWGGRSIDGNDNASGEGGRYNPVTDTWSAITFSGSPGARYDHTIVWTGTRMIVWGGFNGIQRLNTGGVYDPVANSWTPTSFSTASARNLHTAVWTGSRMVIWGGIDQNAVNSGGRYDPVTNTWDTLQTSGAPSPRGGHLVVWSGSRMVVWGGLSNGTGGRYDPVSDAWEPTSTTGAPTQLSGPTAVWTGSEMIVWGNRSTTVAGGRYDPAADHWTPVTNAGAPSRRSGHSAVWTGSLMLVWGGTTDTGGGRYAPQSDSWTPIAASAPWPPRYAPSSCWTGNRMLIWGGAGYLPFGVNFANGAQYDPATDTWTPVNSSFAPGSIGGPSVWTGERMIVHGRGVYDPLTDTWVAMNMTGAPSVAGRAVWTGTRMILWGGDFQDSNTGGVYDPAVDSWTPTSTVGAPSARREHSAVWIGDRMVAWGGLASGAYLATGGRYDPVTNTWTPTSTSGTPSPRSGHRAVWTGQQMIVWGGSSVPYLNAGGRYDPASDTWTPISHANAPEPITNHGAVWTGDRMLTWGGGKGGRYDPVTDTWVPMSLQNNPGFWLDSSVVWTGSRLIVWGGRDTNGGFSSNGKQYAWGENRDDDVDGYRRCDGDCDDASPSRNPGRVEICNGLDDDCDMFRDEDAAGQDSDRDAIANLCDNCPGFYNEAQSDGDQDGEGDPCDVDDGSVFVFHATKTTIEWNPDLGADAFNVYEGGLAELRATGVYTQAPGSNPTAERQCGVAATSVADAGAPASGAVAFVLVTEIRGGSEGSLGVDGGGTERANANPCP